MNDLAISWQGEFSPYDRPEMWLPELERRHISPWILGQQIFASHNERRFLTRAVQKDTAAGSAVRLRVEGITPLAPLAILHGRLNEEPLDLFGKIIVPYEEGLDALVRLSAEAKSGTYIFLAQQWEPGGQPAYPGGSLIYASSAASVEVRSVVEDHVFWQTFESWPRDIAEEVRDNIREAREKR